MDRADRSRRSGHPLRTARLPGPATSRLELAAALIEWALEDGYPPAYAIHQLVALTTMSLEAGHNIDDLPETIKPNNVARQGLSRSTMTRQEATSRAAELRAIPFTEDDFARPGEDPAIFTARFTALSQTADYRDYHRLLDTERILTDLRGLVDLITDADLASEVRAWLSVLPDMNPMPTETR